MVAASEWHTREKGEWRMMVSEPRPKQQKKKKKQLAWQIVKQVSDNLTNCFLFWNFFLVASIFHILKIQHFMNRLSPLLLFHPFFAKFQLFSVKIAIGIFLSSYIRKQFPPVVQEEDNQGKWSWRKTEWTFLVTIWGFSGWWLPVLLSPYLILDFQGLYQKNIKGISCPIFLLPNPVSATLQAHQLPGKQ